MLQKGNNNRMCRMQKLVMMVFSQPRKCVFLVMRISSQPEKRLFPVMTCLSYIGKARFLCVKRLSCMENYFEVESLQNNENMTKYKKVWKLLI